ncbi:MULTISPECIES: ArnT family glycosyltransferase [unclassified Nitrospina]|uniref:ArnT family glycosyltransferase n=1 Tax=unclassified Nitrospina TaxID=2638683 RepID=UPI003F97A1E5
MALILTILTVIAWGLAGTRIATIFGVRWASPQEAAAVSVTVGMTLTAWLMMALAFLGALHPVTGWAMLVFLLVLARSQVLPLLAVLWKILRNPSMWPFWRNRPWMETFAILVLGGLAAFAVTLAWAPPVRTDALVYHLAIPQAYLEHHGVVNLPNNMYSFFPLLFEMVYLFGLTFGVEGLPALLGVGQAAALAVGLVAYYRRYLGNRYGWLVPAVFFSVPTFTEIAGSAYVDLPLAGFVFFAFYSWERWRETGHGFWFALLCLFAGSAFATKLTGFIVLPLAALGIVWARRNNASGVRVLGKLFVFAGVVFLCMAPWWGRNFIYSGNPFVPLFMQVLGGQDRINWDPTRALMMDQYVRMFGMGRGFVDFLMLPYNLTFHSEPHSLRFDGRMGIAYLIILPAVIGMWWYRRPRLGPLVVAFAVLILFWFVYFQYIRFLAPALVFLSLLLVYGLEAWQAQTPREDFGFWLHRAWTGLIALGLVFNVLLALEAWNKKDPLAYLAGEESREAYLSRNVSVFPIYQAMNTRVPPDGRVLFVYMRNLGYLAHRDFISDSVFEAHTLQKILQSTESEKEVFQRLQSLGATHIMFDSNYVWGQDSAFPREHQERFHRFLLNRTRQVARQSHYYLHRIVIN